MTNPLNLPKLREVAVAAYRGLDSGDEATDHDWAFMKMWNPVVAVALLDKLERYERALKGIAGSDVQNTDYEQQRYQDQAWAQEALRKTP